jgi:DNA-binding MarR family transcriptional regulator
MASKRPASTAQKKSHRGWIVLAVIFGILIVGGLLGRIALLAFVTRQSMNVLLQAMERDGLVTRAAEAPVGKALPTSLTPRGRRALETASAAVRSVESRMLSGITDAEQAAALVSLRSMIAALRDDEG